MSMCSTRLDRTLRSEGIPIDGVCAHPVTDKARWRIDFKPDATPEQRARAAQIVQAFDQNDPAHERAELEDLIKREMDRRLSAAYSWVLLKRLFPLDTDAQTKAKLALMRDEVVAAAIAQPWK